MLAKKGKNQNNMPNNDNAEGKSRVEELLEKNIEYNKKILQSVEKTRKYINYLKIVNMIKLIVIIVPLILALIYVPPFLQDMIEIYKDLFGGASTLNIIRELQR